jgi:hypothetical protein
MPHSNRMSWTESQQGYPPENHHRDPDRSSQASMGHMDIHLVEAISRIETRQKDGQKTLRRIEERVSQPPRRFPDWFTPQLVAWGVIVLLSLLGHITLDQAAGFLKALPK